MDFKISDEGYLYVEDKDIGFVTGEEAAKQDFRARVRYIKGEYFLNSDDGIDFGIVQGKKSTDLQIEAQFKKAISASPFFKRFTNFNITVTESSRSAELEFSVECVDGYIIDITERL